MQFVFFFFLLFASSYGAEDYFKKANELYDAGKYAEAVPAYRAAIKNEQMEPYAWFNLGNTDRKSVV